jgi:hypothetical protein
MNSGMHMSTQPGHDLFRLLVYRKEAGELLVEGRSDRLWLPAVPVRTHSRIAEEITATVKHMWNFETYCLFFLSAAQAHFEVLEACQDDITTPAGMQWLPITSLAAGAFGDATDQDAALRSVEALDQYRNGQLPGPLGKPGWLPEVTEWVGARAAASGLRITGKFQQLNASPATSLIRFETNGPALWFKAVGEPNRREYSITMKLGSALPEFLPRIIGALPDWNAWLSLETDGSLLNSASNGSAWAAAAENLALLQLASLTEGFEFVEDGAKDLRPSMLRKVVEPFFATMAQLMQEQTKPAPAPLSREELQLLAQSILIALDERDSDGVPDTLGHLDLNPANAVVSGSRCVFLDWAEAYVGPPFLSLQNLLEHWRRSHGKDAEGFRVASYTKHWLPVASPEQISTSLYFAPLLSVFAHATGLPWESPEDVRPAMAGYLRSLARRMKREAGALRERRLICAL